jgi:hypothetical protein
MLYPYNEYLLKVDAKVTTAKYLREAEIDRLISELYSRRPSWLSHQARRALSTLGYWLITLGQRLDPMETHTT